MDLPTARKVQPSSVITQCVCKKENSYRCGRPPKASYQRRMCDGFIQCLTSLHPRLMRYQSDPCFVGECYRIKFSKLTTEGYSGVAVHHVEWHALDGERRMACR
jgi:hypothetical protein